MRIAIEKKSFRDNPHCGDQCAWWRHGGRITLCMADGLGHGEGAENAANAAMNYVKTHLSNSLTDIFTECDGAIRHTRGVAMGIAVIDKTAQTLAYAGIGNIRAVVVRDTGAGFSDGNARRLPNNYGIVGGGFRKLTPETVPLMPGNMVILATDGINERFDILKYGKAVAENEKELARRIMLGWRRETDDAAVLVFNFT